MSITRRVSSAVVVLSSVIAALFWLLLYIDGRVARDYQQVLQPQRRPMLLNGVRLNVSMLPLEPIRQPSLFVVVDDQCNVCQDEVPKWLPTLREGAIPLAVAAVVVSKRGHRLGAELTYAVHSSGRSVKYVQLDEALGAAFSVRAGVSATPLLLLLDESGVIRVVGYRLNAEFVQAAHRALGLVGK